MSPDLYIPPNSQPLNTISFPQIRLALQGASGTGKTFSALTFPNPVVLDIDNLLVAHTHRKDVIRIPLWDNEWIKANIKGLDPKFKYPIRDAIKIWMTEHATKLQANQTLFIDSWTTLQDAFDLQTKLEPTFTDKGELNKYTPWDLKIDFSREILSTLKTLKCHTVVSFHEQADKDANGALLGKIEPLMQGKFQKKLGLYFTEWFRCITESKFDPTDKKKIIGTEYKWQTKSTSDINLKSRFELPMLAEPNFKIFQQALELQNKQNTTT